MTLLSKGIETKNVLPTEINKRIAIGNNSNTYKVYKIRLDQLYYNDQNDRIATWMSQYKQENNIETLDLSDRDKYNAIIHNFITESNKAAIKNTQQNIAIIGQQEQGVVLSDGRIIDGNRRFTCLRNIEKETSIPQYFEAVVLEHSIEHNAKQIKMLELMLQHGVDEKVGYNPIDRLVGIYNDIILKKLLTVEEYANSVYQSPKEIEKEVAKANLMVEYLEFINAPNQFYIARDMSLNDPLKDACSILKKCKDDDQREDLKNIIFSQLLSRPMGDMTRYIRNIDKIVTNPTMLEGYIEEQMEVTEKVCEILDEVPNVTTKELNEVIRTHENMEEIKYQFAKTTEKWKAKSDGEKVRNQPFKQVDKAFNALELVDVNILAKLASGQKQDIYEKLDDLEVIIDQIRSGLNV